MSENSPDILSALYGLGMLIALVFWIAGYFPKQRKHIKEQQARVKEAKEYLAALKAEKELQPRPPFDLKKTLRAMWRETGEALIETIRSERESRILQDEFGKWPVIKDYGGYYVIKARHSSPQMGWKIANIGKSFIGLGALIGFFSGDRSGNILVSVIVWLIIGGIISAIAMAIGRFVLRPKLKISLMGGILTWLGPDGKTCRVDTNKPWVSVVYAPHRLASVEQRDNNTRVRTGRASNPGSKLPEDFTTASELVIHNGPGQSMQSPVAEIAKDETGSLAHVLKAAIDLVVERSIVDANKTAAILKTQQQSRIGDGRYD